MRFNIKVIALKIVFMFLSFLCFCLLGLNFIRYRTRQSKHENGKLVDFKSDFNTAEASNVSRLTTEPKLICPTYKFSNEMSHMEALEQNAIALPQRQAIIRRFEVSEITMYQFDKNLKMNLKNFGFFKDNNETSFGISRNIPTVSVHSISTRKLANYLKDTRCKMNQTRSCIENYQFNDLNNSLEKPYEMYSILKVEWNLTNDNLKKAFYLDHPKPNAVYSLELSSDCSDYLSSLFSADAS